MNNVSAVICTWNSISSIRACLESLRANDVGEIIVVDADSEDGTRQVALEYANHVVSDSRQGLAAARNIGIALCTRQYTLNMGADNVLPAGGLARMLECANLYGWTGVSAVTVLRNQDNTWLSWSLNHYKMARYYPGQRAVIGTPTLFLTALLRQYPFDPRMSWSDDGDLCTRLSRLGMTFGIADVRVYELGSANMPSIHYRWKGYGKSDWETYRKYHAQWRFARRIQSWLYPLRQELIRPFIRIRGFARFGVLPFLVLITSIRYRYWITFAFRDRK